MKGLIVFIDNIEDIEHAIQYLKINKLNFSMEDEEELCTNYPNAWKKIRKINLNLNLNKTI
jgi:hypothetical protein